MTCCMCMSSGGMRLLRQYLAVASREWPQDMRPGAMRQAVRLGVRVFNSMMNSLWVCMSCRLNSIGYFGTQDALVADLISTTSIMCFYHAVYARVEWRVPSM